MNYDDLFMAVHEALHERTGKCFERVDLSDLARACSGDLEWTRSFAFDNHLDFTALAESLWDAGATCDCELLTVARKRMPSETPLPELACP
jgi:hypothetical protein